MRPPQPVGGAQHVGGRVRWVATSSSCILTLAEAKSLLSMLAPRKPAISERSCSSSSIWLRSAVTCLDASRMPMGTLAWEGEHSISYTTHCEANGSLPTAQARRWNQVHRKARSTTWEKCAVCSKPHRCGGMCKHALPWPCLAGALSKPWSGAEALREACATSSA
jgi:hypothetical protein